MTPKFEPTRYRKCAEAVLANLLRLPGLPGEMQGRTGHAFCATTVQSGRFLACEIVGKIEDAERRSAVATFAQEKPRRLYEHPGLMSSYLCRNAAENKYGGAIRGVHFNHSVSAYPADIDEVVSFATGIRYGDCLLDHAEDYFALRRAVAEIRLPSGLVVPVEPNAFANFLPDLLASK